MSTREHGYPTTDAVRVRRVSERGRYDAATVDAILDEALICHVAFVHRDGHPMLIPTLHARDGDRLLLHMSTGSRLARQATTGPVPVSVAVTVTDGIVLARSGFHHSMNYRSVVVVGSASALTTDAAKRAALDRFVDHVVPGRAAALRPPTRRELVATTVLSLDLSEASAKVRTGGVNDEPEDMDLPVWAGVLPLRLVAGDPEPDAALDPSIPLPDHVRDHPLARPG
jgi:nitroimidazol reductase NimA-like FMN-containing flavoprotein (pyridoxamine 5'-phosphate oxidase superfamily)